MGLIVVFVVMKFLPILILNCIKWENEVLLLGNGDKRNLVLIFFVLITIFFILTGPNVPNWKP